MPTFLWMYLLCMLLCCVANDLGMPQPISAVQYPQHRNAGGGRSSKEIKFTVYQTVVGVNSKAFNTNYNVNSETYKQTIASCMTGVLPDDIYNLRAEPCNANNACSQLMVGAKNGPEEVDSNSFAVSREKTRKVTHPSERLIITYTVKLRSMMAPFKLYSQLLSATTGSVFDDNLQLFASDNDAVELYNVDTSVTNVVEKQASTTPSLRNLRADSQVASASRVWDFGIAESAILYHGLDTSLSVTVGGMLCIVVLFVFAVVRRLQAQKATITSTSAASNRIVLSL